MSMEPTSATSAISIPASRSRSRLRFSVVVPLRMEEYTYWAESLGMMGSMVR